MESGKELGLGQSDLIMFSVLLSLFLWNCLKISLKVLSFVTFGVYLLVSSTFQREK